MNPDIWAIMDHDPAPFYAKGNVVMIGDAAHVSDPQAASAAADQVSRRSALSSATVRPKRLKMPLRYKPYLRMFRILTRFLRRSSPLTKYGDRGPRRLMTFVVRWADFTAMILATLGLPIPISRM